MFRIPDSKGEKNHNDTAIYIRDMNWLQSADVVIAEVSTPSLGVGYELGISEKMKKPILCLYKDNKNASLSAMVKGNNKLSCSVYHNLADAKSCIDTFLENLI